MVELKPGVLYVDTRGVGEGEIGDVLASLSMRKVATVPLHSADYAWVRSNGKSRGLERKTLSNLVSSLKSGELEDQLTRCLEDYDDVDVLLEGVITMEDGEMVDLRPGRKAFTNLSLSTFSRLLSAFSEGGIGLILSPSTRNTPSVLLSLFDRDQKFQETKLFKGGRRRTKPNIYSPREDVVALMSLWERLPERVAKALLEKRSVWEVLHLEDEKLMEFEGVGKKMVENLNRKLGRR